MAKWRHPNPVGVGARERRQHLRSKFAVSVANGTTTRKIGVYWCVRTVQRRGAHCASVKRILPKNGRPMVAPTGLCVAENLGFIDVFAPTSCRRDGRPRRSGNDGCRCSLRRRKNLLIAKKIFLKMFIPLARTVEDAGPYKLR